MFMGEIDSQFIASVNCFYATDDAAKEEQLPLQLHLEEAIKNKMGITKDFSGIISLAIKKRQAESTNTTGEIEDNKMPTSDNELELDLLKEDLMCIVCDGMDVGARNQLLECSSCHMLYHQECHNPIVTSQENFDVWKCQNCKDFMKKLEAGPAPATSASPTTTSKSSSSSSKSGSHKTSSGNGSGSHKSNSKGEKHSKSTSGKTSSKSTASGSSSSSRSNVTPNINIISADKRIQIMKKKAAKLQEKRKHSR